MLGGQKVLRVNRRKVQKEMLKLLGYRLAKAQISQLHFILRNLPGAYNHSRGLKVACVLQQIRHIPLWRGAGSRWSGSAAQQC